MEENRTVVLMATMRSPIIGSPDQTEKRPLLRQEGSTSASDRTRFSRMRGVPEGGHTTEQRKVAGSIPAGHSLQRGQLTFCDLDLAGPRCDRQSLAMREVAGPFRPHLGLEMSMSSLLVVRHPPVTNVARNCVPSGP